ncbi:phage tail tube protein [Mesorhizobium sp. RMAD-H1]|uniref:phage tail tube protein n=1 Tax=Mesorhizobium sp. RMAD-H1 TaxID=2587065 RepID=UPI00160C5C63|nr:phage tail tube protein [Mesorhizobium sp. RMAD-H1]MBB2973947.1 hypothetical protein [Mesorhizobium sp. RMAD-H1]
MPAYPKTEKYEEMILEVEFDPVASPGVYSRICGLSGVTINRTLNTSEDQIPPCDDESQPNSTEVNATNLVVTVSAQGKWAQSSQSKMKDWIYNARKLNVRLTDAAAATGDIASESGPALCTALNAAREKGVTVTQDIEIRFDGRPTLTNAA